VKDLTLTENIESKILIIRGKKVLLDRDLATLYGVETKRLNEQVKRNIKRFPQSFMLRINEAEKEELVANCDRFRLLKHSTSLPYAFTEYGALMSANILNSEKAIQISIFIVEAFARIREVLSAHKDIMLKISEIEKRLDYHDDSIIEIIKTLKELIPSYSNKPKIGFDSSE
jgi:phage regulator Rha-like protein